MKNKIEDLRNHLFATLEALSDKENPMEISRALAVATVAREITESAKVEVKHMELTGSLGSGFIAAIDKASQPNSTPRLISSKD